MNIKNINIELNKLENTDINQRIYAIIDYIGNNYGNLSYKECIDLLNKSAKISNLFKRYLDDNQEYYTDTKRILNANLKNMIEAFVYISGCEQVQELGINTNEDYSETDIILDDISQKDRYDSVGIYMNSLHNYPVLTREEEQELAAKMRNGDKNARKKLIECNLKLVVSIVAQIVRKKGEVIPFMDMVEEGNTGLILAIDKYDVTRGTKISTYVTSSIVSKITIAIDKQSKVIAKPRHYSDTYKKYKQLITLMSFILNRDATKEEIANILNVTVEIVDNFESLQGKFISMNSLVGDDEDTELYEIIPDDKNESIEQEYDNAFLAQEIKRIINELPIREADILYGIFYEKLNLEAIAKRNNLTRERIRQIVVKTLEKLSHRKDIRNLLPYIADKDFSEVKPYSSIQAQTYGYRKFNRKNQNIKKNSEVAVTPLYEKIRVACQDLQAVKYTYEDLAIDNNKRKNYK